MADEPCWFPFPTADRAALDAFRRAARAAYAADNDSAPSKPRWLAVILTMVSPRPLARRAQAEQQR